MQRFILAKKFLGVRGSLMKVCNSTVQTFFQIVILKEILIIMHALEKHTMGPSFLFKLMQYLCICMIKPLHFISWSKIFAAMQNKKQWKAIQRDICWASTHGKLCPTVLQVITFIHSYTCSMFNPVKYH